MNVLKIGKTLLRCQWQRKFSGHGDCREAMSLGFSSLYFVESCLAFRKMFGVVFTAPECRPTFVGEKTHGCAILNFCSPQECSTEKTNLGIINFAPLKTLRLWTPLQAVSYPGCWARLHCYIVTLLHCYILCNFLIAECYCYCLLRLISLIFTN